MKKLLFPVLLLFFLLSFDVYASASVTVRPYGTIGGTVIDLPGANDWDTLKSGGGLQGLYHAFPNIHFGVDLAFNHAYWVRGTYGADIEYLNLLAVAEYHNGIMILQAGLGPYFGIGANEDTPFGMMLGGGVDIPINERLAIALLARFDLVFENAWNGDGVTFMPAFMAGFSVKF